jgi:GGDEF domain-containing protein
MTGAAGGPEAEEVGGWADSATGLPGPSFWRTIVAAESARHRRYGGPVTVVLAELVGLEHLEGPERADVEAAAVAATGRVLRHACRASDHVVRLGHRLFGLLLPETNEIDAINFVERARERCAAELGDLGEGLDVTFGWASPTGSLDLVAAVAIADDRLRRERGQRERP